MIKWQSLRADEFCYKVTDGTHDSPKPQSYGHKLITSKHLKGSYIDFESANWISEADYQKVISRSSVEQWDVLFSMIGTVGRTYIEKSDQIDYACKNMGIFKFNGNQYDAYWMYYYLNSPEAVSYIQSHLYGSTQTYVSLGTLREMPVLMPPKSIRNKIVRILRLLDDKIELNNEINNNLEQQAQAIYQHMFIDSPCAEWTEGSLSDIAEVSSGKRPPMKSTVCTNETDFPIVGAADVMGFTNSFNYNEKILIIGRVGTHGIVQRFNSPCWASDNTLVITSNYYEYVYQILKRIDYHSLNRGSTQPLITQSDINKVPVLLPDNDTLIEYETLAGTLMSEYEANVIENTKLSEIRDTLLPRLMSGEIDVSDIDV